MASTQIWACTIKFLFVFRTLKYDSVPLNLLLFRDFQRYCKRNGGRLPKRGIKVFPASKIQAVCSPYFKAGNPNLSLKGYTLVRADLYTATRNIKGEKFLYLAHGKKEFRRLSKVRGCRPLLFLPKLKAAGAADNKRKILLQLQKIFAAHTTPPFLKTPGFRRWMSRRVMKAMRMLDKMHTLFRKYPIKQTVYGSTLNQQGALVTSYAQSRRILTVNLQHGIFGQFGHLPVNADLNLVWGKSHADFLVRSGAPANRIKIVGPVFCRSMNPKAEVSAKARKKAPGLRILVATQPIGNAKTARMLRTVDYAALKLKTVARVDYKLHPDQGGGAGFRKYIRHRKSAIIPHGKISLQDLMQQADVIITPFSTVAYEALVQNKPVLYYGRRRKMYYLKSRPICFQNAAQLIKLLKIQAGSRILKVSLKDTKPVTKRNSSQVSQLWEAIREYRGVSRSDNTVEINSNHTCKGRVEGPSEQEQEKVEQQTANCPHDRSSNEIELYQQNHRNDG